MKNYLVDIKEVRRDILSELTKCSYCGVCEWICPTLSIYQHRMYGPRGRVEIMISILMENHGDDIVNESIFTCLLCRACTIQCPAGIDIQNYIRLFRFLSRAKG